MNIQKVLLQLCQVEKLRLTGLHQLTILKEAPRHKNELMLKNIGWERGWLIQNQK